MSELKAKESLCHDWGQVVVYYNYLSLLQVLQTYSTTTHVQLTVKIVVKYDPSQVLVFGSHSLTVASLEFNTYSNSV